MAENELSQGISRKVGGLPVWVWAVGAVGAGLGVYMIFFRKAGGAEKSQLKDMGYPLPPGFFGGAGGGGGDNGPKVPKYLSNQDWLDDAVQQVMKSVGLPAAQVRLYLEEYLSGAGPVGNREAGTAYNRVIQAAISLLGRPPDAVGQGDPNRNPFSSNTTYLNQLLGFLPAGTLGRVQQELINLFNGRTTQISADAEKALLAVYNILGVPPTAIYYTVLGGSYGQPVTNSDIQAYARRNRAPVWAVEIFAGANGRRLPSSLWELENWASRFGYFTRSESKNPKPGQGTWQWIAHTMPSAVQGWFANNKIPDWAGEIFYRQHGRLPVGLQEITNWGWFNGYYTRQLGWNMH